MHEDIHHIRSRMPDVRLRNSLLATLAYFDLFEYPLTLAELLRFRLLPRDAASAGPCRASDALSALADDSAFGHRDGFWFLAGREKNVETRRRRFRLAEAKRARARKVTAFLRLLPSVRMVAICNSLAIANADTESDIDLFVICRPATLWITRLLVVSVLAAFGLRPDERTHADRVCMSFFVSEAAADLSRFALAPDDTYLRYWIATLDTTYDDGGAFENFLRVNAWIHERLPAIDSQRGEREARSAEDGASRRAFLFLLKRLDGTARRLQMRMFPKAITAVANLDSRVVISDDALKFHVVDRRAEYERRFRERLRELGIADEAEGFKSEKVERVASETVFA
jgi:predicted nucleotidyltransferase